jgi:hypothetical protein
LGSIIFISLRGDTSGVVILAKWSEFIRGRVMASGSSVACSSEGEKGPVATP